ncbi:DUF1343 domain-containing protein [Pontibacter sp. G13]|uniref:exo-beta-N-acetylmuramidase NamZ family protein n=1 Tax=Pontibacter sp. G13 TaxID=3074898 RepID=UPI00288A8829|nr:DUF1343 domain-containing protein [Pontibacter sp. G13]WNJ18203.1 DUF1343 domain-containing protein [Pontibacter sp. G13]
MIRSIAKYTNFLLIPFMSLTISTTWGCNDAEDSHATLPTEPSAATGDSITFERGSGGAGHDHQATVRTGAEIFVSEMVGKWAADSAKVVVVANHTTQVFGGVHLVDTLIGSGVQVVKVFAPEHGFRGTADAGEAVQDGIDKKTGVPVISLYGKLKKPTPELLKGVDAVFFDIQDVGSRHYTYISTMTYVMEACAELGIPFYVLDRPNPNGWYVDGPVLETGSESFIGMHQVPIVHGMSIGEYAQMVNGEHWMKNGVEADLTVIPCEGYEHDMRWEETGLEWIPPSPNLGTEYSAYLYPALCWLEPTPMSVGRGTDSAFTVAGAPWFETSTPQARMADGASQLYGLEADPTDFTPRSLPGKSKYPKFQDQQCHGWVFRNRVEGKELLLAGLSILGDSYRQHQQAHAGDSFFKKGFHKWPGNKTLKSQIQSGMSPEEIYESWRPKVEDYIMIRRNYLIYP